MRHGKKFNHLSRKKGHRKALLRNMAIALITHKRISTTLAKGRALRQFIEPLLTKAKNNTTHSRRVVFSYLQNKEAVKELFGDIASKIANRPGGYVRVLKTGFRNSDAADTCIIELVDYNTDALESTGKKRKRARRGRKNKKTETVATTETAVEEKTENTDITETKKEDSTNDDA